MALVVNRKMSDLNEKWNSSGYSKLSDSEHHFEFGIIEALLWEKIDIHCISRSGSEHPWLLKDDEKAELVLHCATQARKLENYFHGLFDYLKKDLGPIPP
ncbi:MAG: hypothetical protein HKM93_08320 [Desulfobacteraceae bacterium]|nr:hypothetical protein [Desulfobacteraceae bacterium]